MTRSILYKYSWKTLVFSAVAVGVISTAVLWFRDHRQTPLSLLIHAAFMTVSWGILIGLYALQRMGNQNRKPLTFPLNENGSVEGSATLASFKWIPTSGWFILSNDSLKFFSRSRKKDIAIPLKDIASVDRSTLPSTLKFQLEDGSKYSFNVGDRERWLEEIEHARSTNP